MLQYRNFRFHARRTEVSETLTLLIRKFKDCHDPISYENTISNIQEQLNEQDRANLEYIDGVLSERLGERLKRKSFDYWRHMDVVNAHPEKSVGYVVAYLDKIIKADDADEVYVKNTQPIVMTGVDTTIQHKKVVLQKAWLTVLSRLSVIDFIALTMRYCDQRNAHGERNHDVYKYSLVFMHCMKEDYIDLLAKTLPVLSKEIK